MAAKKAPKKKVVKKAAKKAVKAAKKSRQVKAPKREIASVPAIPALAELTEADLVTCVHCIEQRLSLTDTLTAPVADALPSYAEILQELLVLIGHLSGAAVDGSSILGRIPNLTIEPTLRRAVNGRWFPDGGGFPPGSIKPEWSVAMLARVILHMLQ